MRREPEPRAVDTWRRRTQLASAIALALLALAFLLGGTAFLLLGCVAGIMGLVSLACVKRWRDALTAEQEPLR